MFWVGFLSVALIVFILVVIYSSLYMAKRADEDHEKGMPAMNFAMEASEELVEHEKIKEES